MGGGPSAAVYGRQRKQEVRNKIFGGIKQQQGRQRCRPCCWCYNAAAVCSPPAEIEPYSDISASRDRAASALRLRRKNAQPSPFMRAACAAEGKKPTGNSNSKACLPPRALTFYLFTLKIVALILLNVFFIQSFLLTFAVALILLNVFFIQSFLLTFAANLTSCFLFLTFIAHVGELFSIYYI